jgi:streptomycin 3"-adenylyltransferase
VPAEAAAAMQVVRACLGDRLVAAYLHGSAVAGGLRPDSDVDVLVVVERTMAPKVRGRLLEGLMAVSGVPGGGDPRRPLEVIVVVRADLAGFAHPGRCDFLYGEWLRAAFEAGAVPEPEADPELTILLPQARQTAVTLAGPDAAALLPAIPEPVLRRAIGDALPALLGGLEGDERNVLLTLARMWCTLETGRIVPKDAAAAWAIPRLPELAAAVMEGARRGYLGLAEDDWAGRRVEVERVAGELRERVAGLV